MYGLFSSCPKRLSYGGSQLTSNLKINPSMSTVYVLESRLISRDGATLLSGSVNSKTAYWPNTSSR